MAGEFNQCLATMVGKPALRGKGPEILEAPAPAARAATAGPEPAFGGGSPSGSSEDSLATYYYESEGQPVFEPGPDPYGFLRAQQVAAVRAAAAAFDASQTAPQCCQRHGG